MMSTLLPEAHLGGLILTMLTCTLYSDNATPWEGSRLAGITE
jgi:hypothetical protein